MTINKPILIITGRDDVHADHVILELAKLGRDVVRLNTEDLSNRASYSIELTRSRNACFNFSLSIRDSGKAITRDSFDTVWYRKPNPIPPPANVVEESAKEFVREEYEYFLRSLYCLLEQKHWVNPFWSLRRANQKLPNLELAAQLGFRVPRTIVTNDAVNAEAFAEACGWNILVKTFNFSGFVVEKKEAWHCFAHKLSSEELRRFRETVRLSPTFLQEYIDKSVELRVTIIGTQLFTAAIHSQDNAESKWDWRAANPYELLHQKEALPVELSQKLLEFNQHYGLEFSTFDIIRTPEKEYVFLECNPNGQWYWVEELTALPMAAQMAWLLNSKTIKK